MDDIELLEITHFYALVCGLSDYSNMEEKGFASMPAAKTDVKEFEQHLRQHTFFRLNIKTLMNFSKDQFEDTFTELTDEMNELRVNDKNARIAFLFYFSGHGCTFKNSNMLTNMVMINDGDGFVKIEEKLRKLSRKPNHSVSAILDCCRNEIEPKSMIDTNKPDYGQLSILFGCKQGNISTIANNRSILTKAYIEHFEDPRVQARPYPNMAMLGFTPVARYAEHINNTQKCYRIYEAVDITEKTKISQFLSFIAVQKLGRQPDALQKFAQEFEDNFVDTVLQLQQMPESDWGMFKIPPALQRTIITELDNIGNGRQNVDVSGPQSQQKQDPVPVKQEPIREEYRPVSTQSARFNPQDEMNSSRSMANFTAPAVNNQSTNTRQNPGPYPDVAISGSITGKVPGLVTKTAPPQANRPPNPIFLTYKDRFLQASQMCSYIDASLEFVVNMNMPTSNGDPTYYTGYKNQSGGKHGAGKITYVSGNEYQGQFNNGLKHGKGQFIYASNQSVYKGQWKDDLKHGQGLQTWTTGAKYEGKFSQNKKHGQATYTMANGDTDTGPWDNDTRHGEFMLVKAGKKVKYEYNHNKWVREIPM